MTRGRSAPVAGGDSGCGPEPLSKGTARAAQCGLAAAIRRREFMIVTVGGLATLAAAQAVAEKPAKPARVGYVWIGTRGSSPDLDGLLEGFADRGYAAGRNLLLEERYADGHPERLPGLFAELLALKADVLLTPGFQTTLAAQRATSTGPIVSVSEDPVGAGLVKSLSHPGGNVTGLSPFSDVASETWLELLKDASPTLRRIAVLWSPDSPVLAREIERMRKAASSLELDVTAFSARPEEIDARLGAIATARPDGLVVCDAPLSFSIRPRLIAFAARYRLLTLYAGSAAYARQGGLMSHSANFSGLWRHAAGYVDRILKGARPSELPIEQSMGFLLLINLKTAKALGLAIPQSLLLRADEVIQ
jgi:putative ABC transport system substrate-binding protein